MTAEYSRAVPAARAYDKGMTVIVVDEQKLNPYDVQAGHKTLDYLCRARLPVSQLAAGEKRFGSTSITTCSREASAICSSWRIRKRPLCRWRRNCALVCCARDVPYSKSNVLPGIMRAAVIEQAARLGIEVIRAAIDVNRLLESREVFLTNSIMSVMPVCRIERKAISDDKPGPVTRALTDVRFSCPGLAPDCKQRRG